ncbi:MAG: ABC transporter substrate-binding protein [Dehalococcoidales bacterium]|jgi:iron complex transport system substrate-binding protein|nr:ABC transporter substrate-binding protein [Dehalococcoidales bacterium]
MGKEQKKQISRVSRREFMAGAGALVLTGVLSGCKPDVITTTVNSTKTVTHNETQRITQTVTSYITTTQTVSERSSFTVTDMAGRTVEIPGVINKIATFGANGVLNTMVETMGCGAKIANQMRANFTKTDKWKYQFVFAPQLNDCPVLETGSEIDIEAVLQLNPDICLCMSLATATLLEAKGLAVIYLEWQTLANVEPCITLLGRVFGKEDIAADYMDYFNNKVAQAGSLTAGIAEQDRKKVLYGGITSYTQPHAIAEWWIYQAGGYSVTSEGRNVEEVTHPSYTLEDILMWNPDVMVTTDTAMAGELRAMDTLKDVNAIKNNEIYYIPTVAHVWGNRTTEQPLTIFWMMNKLYPEIMPLDTLREEIRYFYSHFFLTELTDAQITEIIG